MGLEDFALKNGTVLRGRYRIDGLLDYGGIGLIYVAHDDELARKVVVKEYFPESWVCREKESPEVIAHNESVFTALKRKLMEKMRSIIHAGSLPGMAQVYDLFEENGTAYIVNEYVEGEKLDEYIKRKGKLPFKEAFELLLPTMHELSDLHEKGIVHGTVSPQNIVIRRETGKVVLLDCGERNFKEDYVESGYGNFNILLHPYQPMECFIDRMLQFSGQTDEYSLCATLYFVLTGIEPVNTLLRFYQKDPIQPPSALGADISGACEAVLLKGMSVRKEDRYPTIAKLREAFDALIAPATQKTEDKPVSCDQDDRKEPTKDPEKPAGDWRSPYALKNGTVIGGEYKIIRLVGGGHYGHTYVASDMVTDRRVAIREFFPSRIAVRRIEESNLVISSGENEDILLVGKRRVYREAKAAYGMKSLLRTADVYDVVVENDTVYVVMEYVEGETLYNHVRQNGALRYQQAANLLFPLLPDLIRIHEMGSAHGNVNPHNIVIRRDTGEAVLLDLGATHSWYEFQEKIKNWSEDMNFPTNFDAWEQRSMQQTDARTDVFGFCASLYYALTGKNPKFCLDYQKGIKTPGQFGSDISLACEQALMRGLGGHESRYASIRDLCQALRVDMDRLPKPPHMPDLDAHMEECFIRVDDPEDTTGGGDEKEPASSGVPAMPAVPSALHEKTQEAGTGSRKGKGLQIAVSLLVALAGMGVCVGAALLMMK